MTDPITAALDRLQEYAAAHPEHDTDELVARARAELARPADAPPATLQPAHALPLPTPPSISKRPSNWELLATINKAAINFPPSHPEAQPLNAVEYPLALELRKARAVLARWGQPPAPPAEGEAGVIDAIADCLQADASSSTILDRIAALLERHAAPVPVPVAERPWEREGWCDEQGCCWFGREESDDWSADWTLTTPAVVEEFCTYAPRTVCLPAHALPLPAQGGEVEP